MLCLDVGYLLMQSDSDLVAASNLSPADVYGYALCSQVTLENWRQCLSKFYLISLDPCNRFGVGKKTGDGVLLVRLQLVLQLITDMQRHGGILDVVYYKI